MCGIFCSLLQDNNSAVCVDTADKNLVCNYAHCPVVLRTNCDRLLSNRGPDAGGEISIALGQGWKAYFSAHILWLQGNRPTLQPIADEDNNILLWNGDVFNSDDDNGLQCDTDAILKALYEANYVENSEDVVLEVLSKIEGPWSFMYWRAREKQLWFGRDAMGRHSLLWSQPADSTGLILTSVASRREFPSCRELPAAGVFVANLSDSGFAIKLYPWNTTCLDKLRAIYSAEDFPPHLEICHNSKLLSPYSLSNLETPLENDKFILIVKNLIASHHHLTPADMFDSLLQDEEIYKRVQELADVLTASVDVRCRTQPQLCKLCVSAKLNSENLISQKCGHSKVALLFSGGLDSAVLAAIADSCVSPSEPIDLINVAFQCEKIAGVPANRKQRRSKEQNSNNAVPSSQACLEEIITGPKTNAKFDVPDRLTGKKTYQELVLIKPNRIWNFVEVNVTKAELAEKRQEKIADLIHPRCSVLDDSLGCAVWFAARGTGTLHQPDGTTQLDYTSPARVLLLGMGADELLGGYSRHRKLLSRDEDWSQLAQALNHDLIALPTRNLGRDDRVTQDSGRQARFPYLGEGVVRLVASLPVHLRTVPLPGLPAGVGEKVLLRLLAARLGLAAAAQAPKRAMQFGSRVAGLEAPNEKGDAPCSRLLLSHLSVL